MSRSASGRCRQATPSILKRGKGRGFSGVENDLFVAPKTSMLFGDARQSLLELGFQGKEA
jgi:NAD(P) transhydrogenase subunit beta